MNTPGNDVESTTALAGSGANIILFTTGLGTPTGKPDVPVIKVSSNSVLSSKMNDIIDIDTGPIISGEKSIEEMADELMELIIDIASGTKQSKAVINQQYDFILGKEAYLYNQPIPNTANFQFHDKEIFRQKLFCLATL